MLRRCFFLLKEDQEVARALAQRKKNWVDRRRHTPKADGKTRNKFDETPSCQLCQRRFMFAEDFQAHKDSPIHQDRLRWVETEAWYKLEGVKMVRDKDQQLWNEFHGAVVVPEA